MRTADDKKGRTGPKPERVKIEGDWESAVEKALKKPKPAEGWPDPPKRKAKGKKGR